MDLIEQETGFREQSGGRYRRDPLKLGVKATKVDAYQPKNHICLHVKRVHLPKCTCPLDPSATGAKLVPMPVWTFADNLAFTRRYDFAHIIRSSDDPEATLESLREPSPLRPTENSPWLLWRLRRCWDHLRSDRVVMTLQATREAMLHRKSLPREAWLVLGLASLPEDEWIPPQDPFDLIEEITISVDGDQDFKDELTAWVRNTKRRATIQRVLHWIPWS